MTNRRWFRIATIGTSLLLSALFAYAALHDVDWGRTAHALRASNYWWLLPALAALALSLLVRIERWRILFRTDQRPAFGALTRAMLAGLFFNVVLPARAGDAARVVALRADAGTSAAESGATIVVERLIDVLTLLALLFVTVPWLPSVSWLHSAAVVALVSVVAAGVIVAIAIRLDRRTNRRLIEALARLPLVSVDAATRGLANVEHGLAAIRRPRQVLAAVAWTILSWLILGSAYWFLMVGFHLQLPFLAGVLAVVATGLAFIIPAAPGGAGVFEAAGLASTSAYHVPTSKALAYVLVLHALNVIPYLVAGAVVLLSSARRTPQSSRRCQATDAFSTVSGPPTDD
jgi:uncharacterized protein (TIRG00374 family)